MLYVLFEFTKKRKNLMEIVCVLQAFSISFSIAFVLKTDLYSTHFFGKRKNQFKTCIFIKFYI